MPDTDFIVAIPARFGASRLPGKPLRLIAGTPMVVHVARRALAAGARQVVVATDDARIADALAGESLTVCMTRADHASGTDRLAECAEQLGWSDTQIVVNLQDDEPFAPPEGIHAVAAINAALLGRTRTGQGQHIDMALYDTLVSMHEYAVQCYTLSGGQVLPEQTGHDMPASTLYGVFRAAEHQRRNRVGVQGMMPSPGIAEVAIGDAGPPQE